jgi:hypothetical protein
MQIPAETSVRVDGIAFAQKNSQLVADIDVSFPYFEIKSFSILKPDRVVMDVTPMSKPPEGLVLEDRLERESEPEPVKVIPETPPTELLADREVITPSTTGQKTSEERIKAVETAKPTKPKEPVSAPLQSQIGPSEKKTKKEPAAAKELPSTQAREKHVPRATQAPALEPHSTGLQTTLLVILLALSTVIVALLAVIVFKKRRGVAKKEDFLDISDDREGSLAEIDDKLRRELRKIE